MVDYVKFKDYLLREDLTRAGFYMFENKYSDVFKKGDVVVYYRRSDYSNGRGILTAIEVNGQNIEGYVNIPEPSNDDEDELYYRITDEAILWLYNRIYNYYQ